MKKKLAKILSLALAVAMLFSVSALAASVTADNTVAENNKATIKEITGVDGSTVTFKAIGTNEADEDYIPDTESEKYEVTYEKTGLTGMYLVVALSAAEQKDAPGTYDVGEPGDGNILYIDQVTAGDADGDGISDITFTVYASQMTDSVIAIYGVVPGSESKVLHALIVDAAYILGDVDGDGAVTASDAAKLLRVVAKLESLDSKQTLAGNVDGDTAITASDAAKILRVVAKLETLG